MLHIFHISVFCLLTECYSFPFVLKLSVIYTVKQTPLGYREDQYSTCSDAIFSRMQSYNISISKIASTTGGCPNLVRTSASENSKGFICSSEKKKVTVNQKDYCCKSELSHLLFWLKLHWKLVVFYTLINRKVLSL